MTTKYYQVKSDRITSEQIAYLEAEAVARDTSATALVSRIVEVIARDRLVLSVLDDGGVPAPETKKYHMYKKPETAVRETTPRASAPRVVEPEKPKFQRPGRVMAGTCSAPMTAVSTRRHEPSKEAMRREIEQAMLNTAKLPV